MVSHQRLDPLQPGEEVPLSPLRAPNGDLSVGGLTSYIDRSNLRQGLPGQTPTLDPRLVDPYNSALQSLEGTRRGDINLPSGMEDLTNMLRVHELQKKALGR